MQQLLLYSGELLISSLIIFSVMIARKLVNNFKLLVIVSAIISVVCFLLGIVLSFFLGLPAGASVVLVNTAALVVASIYKNLLGVKLMKKVLIVLASCILVLLLSGCTRTTPQEPELNPTPTSEASTSIEPAIADIVILQESFGAQLTDFYINANNYIGKTMVLEGAAVDTDKAAFDMFGVTRLLNCCEDDKSIIGVSCSYGGEWPKEDEWVRVMGKIELYQNGEDQYPYLAVSSIEVLSQRGEYEVLN